MLLLLRLIARYCRATSCSGRIRCLPHKPARGHSATSWDVRIFSADSGCMCKISREKMPHSRIRASEEIDLLVDVPRVVLQTHGKSCPFCVCCMFLVGRARHIAQVMEFVVYAPDASFPVAPAARCRCRCVVLVFVSVQGSSRGGSCRESRRRTTVGSKGRPKA